jgi:hypothetical protein
MHREIALPHQKSPRETADGLQLPEQLGGIFASLPNHCDRRLNTDNEAVFRLIRTCPGPHVYNALHAGKLLSDQLFNSWIGLRIAVALPIKSYVA